MSSTTAFHLNDRELVELAVTLCQIKDLPKPLLALGRFPASHLDDALMQGGTITHQQLLACAYYGFAPLPPTYHKLCSVIERINRHRDDTEAANSLAGDRNARARVNEAAREFGLTDRHSFKQLHQDLDALAKTHGFDSFEAILNWSKASPTSAGNSSAEERQALAAGPLFLHDQINKARGAKLKDLAFGTHAGWILIAHCDNDVVNLHAIDPSAMWCKGFSKREVVKISLASFNGWPSIIPNEVADTLEQLGREQFPNCTPNIVLPTPTFTTSIELDLVN